MSEKCHTFCMDTNKPISPNDLTPQQEQVISPVNKPAVGTDRSQRKTNFILVSLGLLALILVGVGGYMLGKQSNLSDTAGAVNESSQSDDEIQVECTMEAKICPDGSSVGRIGPDCEFAECPTMDNEATLDSQWEKFVDNKNGFSISYPGDKLVSCFTSGRENDLLLWKAPFECIDGHDIFYLIDVEVVSIPSLAVSHTPSSSEEINVDGVTASKKTYQFTPEDGPLFSKGKATQVTIPLSVGDQQIAITLLGDSEQDLLLFDKVVKSFRFNK